MQHLLVACRQPHAEGRGFLTVVLLRISKFGKSAGLPRGLFVAQNPAILGT
jgi:hypothetical protein